ncbi:unconventional myosin-IXb-like isoform X2 [Homarus americanus]|uniref:unconventional myosin-IXb-like isoform X2 n=1 Tax=Homarus americanus TaxID=6706 RepID=UPI001C475CC4|nr:unconventional myosin-IXb-like isoform X2 [Homarus americanus]
MDYSRYIVQVFVGALSPHYEALSIEVSKQTTSQEITICIVERLGLPNPQHYELAEVIGNSHGQECKERRLGPMENPVALQMLWPQSPVTENTDENDQHEYRFCLREKISSDSLWAEPSQLDSQLIRDYFYKFLYQPKDKEYPDLCQLPNLTEQTLLENLRARFQRGYIYTYVGSILISVNPFKYYPIYNPKYVKLYQNHRLGELPPHIFAIADAAYHSMLKQKRNQCIVISGESGSGKTESTLFLLHHLTMLSQKGSHGSGVEQTILSSGPVLEAFGNAKTAHNNNSSRFGKFIQVTYKENGLVQGACVQKYLLEKSRICSQAYNERSYHVFYYLLAGASPQVRQALHLLKPSDYRYLNQSKCYTIEGCDEQFEFVRLKQSMEMVGFTVDKQHRLFAVLSAVLLLGNIEFQPKKSTYHHDESVLVRNPEQVGVISALLGVSEDTLMNALTSKKARVQGEILVMHYRLPEAVAARDALAKCLYGALFDWIVLQVNYSLITLKESASDCGGNSIGVLDIFGFEDFGHSNRFEQFCINYANEHLQHYFNQHVFEYEQEEYQRENITWTNIEFQDNVDCLALIEGRPAGLLCVLDDQCSFPAVTNETFLQKINTVHKDNKYYEIPHKRESAFIIKHYAGKVKYQVNDFREKNLDLMRPELICVLKNSRYSIVREVAGADPVAVFRWSILRAFFRAVSAFHGAAIKYTKRKGHEDQRKTPKQKIHIDNSRILAAIENTQIRLRKTRHSRSRSRCHGPRHQKNLKTVKALAQRTQSLTLQGRLPGSRKPPHTVTGQFHLSLQTLMEALNTANPFFIRCIKSNANKEPNVFGDEMVMRQLRYTGMLETVRIRQAGFNVRLSYEEFIHHYRILLPKGLLSSQADVRSFLQGMQLIETEYQMGNTKIFMRESQKQKLDSQLHQTILSRIIVIQRWYRTIHQRRHFLTFRAAVVRIQCKARCWIAQQLLAKMRIKHNAATFIQKMWRGHRVRKWYQNFRRALIIFQSCVRGEQSRQRYQVLLEEWKRQKSRGEIKKLREEEETSITSITTAGSTISVTVEIIEPAQPPPRRKLNVQNAQGHKLHRRQSEQILSERRTSEEPQLLIQNLGRRMSETNVPLRRSSHGSTIIQVHARQSDESQGMPSPPASPASAESLSSNQLERKHSSGGEDDSAKLQHQQPSPADSHSMLKFSRQFKKPFKKKMGKREGSLSESEDAMSHESQPQTPTSPGDYQPNFSADLGPDTNTVVIKGRNAGSSGGHQRASVWELSESDEPPRAKEPLKPSSSLPDVVQGFYITEPTGDQGTASTSLTAVCGEAEILKDLLAQSPHPLKQSTLLKKEVCYACDKAFTGFFINTGYKCISCKKIFHSRCVKASLHVACHDVSHFGKENSSPMNKKPRRIDQEDNWNLTRTSEFIDKSDEVIKDAFELRRLEEYIRRKLYDLEEKESEKMDARTQSLDRSFSRDTTNKDSEASARLRDRKDSQVDQMFCQSLREFKNNLVSTYTVAFQKETADIALKYKDLIKNFEQVMNTVCKEKMGNDTFPVTMGVNAFRGFLDEFIREKKKPLEEKSRRKRHRRKKKRIEELVYGGHIFSQIMVNIPTQCEVCNSFLWLSMKALTCQRCKVTCHQKCYKRADSKCSHEGPKPVVVDNNTPPTRNRVLGVPLENLVRPGEKIPSVIDRLITSIELYGLYTEGLYRKSGAQTKVRALKAHMERDPDNIDFTDTPIHVLATILKSFFRELPEPLLTFECYDSLLHATDLQDPDDQLQTIFNIIKGIPKLNYDLLERLIFHMVRVVQHEEHNRMNSNALAIVFAPCILRSQRSQTVQDSLNDIAKQTSVVETIVTRQLRQVRMTLHDIDSVDSATASAGMRLDSIRSLKPHTHRTSALHTDVAVSTLPRPSCTTVRTAISDTSEYDLEEKLENLRDTRMRLEFQLPVLVRVGSEEDLLSTDMSRAGSLEDIPGTPTTSGIFSGGSRESTFGEESDAPSLSGDSTSRQKRRTTSWKRDKSDEDGSVTSRLHQDYSDDAVMV